MALKKTKIVFINFSLLIISFLLILLVTEVLFRIFREEKKIGNLFPSQQDSIISMGQNNKVFINPANRLVYNIDSNKINKEHYTKYFKPRDIKSEKGDGEYRIGVIGDSFTCHGGQYTDMMYGLLNEQKEAFTQIDEFQILTFCDFGLNTTQELAILEGLGLDYDLDFLILQYCDNDINGAFSPVYKINNSDYYEIGGIYVAANSGFFLTDRNDLVPLFPYINKRVSEILLNNFSFFRYLSLKVNIIFTKINYTAFEGERESFASLNAMDEITKKFNIPFSVINFAPARENYCTQSFGLEGSALHDKLKNMANKFGINFYNMCDYVDNDILKIRNNTIQNDDHYSLEGYGIAAEILAKDILDKLK
ncbi:hypothetical protein K8R32_01900 [bacterium]|nr:hypothetical protein [bacterium]